MSHDHHHGHSHSHGATDDSDKRLLTIALGLILGLMAVEFIAGIIANSIALMTDSAHMLTDALALILSLVAISLAQRPAGGSFTYGLRRSEALSGAINGATLAVLGVVVIIESISRLLNPPQVDGALVLVVALVGIAVNIIATWTLSKANRSSLSVEGSFQHLLTDLYAFIGTAIAAAIVLTTRFDRADAIASVMVALLMAYSSWGLLRESGRVMLEGVPRGLELDAIASSMLTVDGVTEVHDLHVWEIGHDFPSLSAHVTVQSDADCEAICATLTETLAHQFNLTHTTLQVTRQASDVIQLQRML